MSDLPKSRLSKFYELTPLSRRHIIAERFGVDATEWEASLSLHAADKMIENVVGVFGLPLGLAVNFMVDGKPVVIPMVTEEPSIVAAASHMASLVAKAGGFKTDVDAPLMIGQIQLLDVSDMDRLCSDMDAQKVRLLAVANGFCQAMVERGGGCREILCRPLAGSVVVHVMIDCRDAMGANTINTVMEGLAPHLEELTGARAGLKILSNLSDGRLARAFCEVPYRLLSQSHTGDDGRDIALRIVEAFQFAQMDPYRACTHNKGIMNGIDAVALATGNDFRAVEAGAHAFAARGGQYAPLSRYSCDDVKQTLSCAIELPLAVGVIGGTTGLHPGAAANLKLLGEFGADARKLAGLMAACGLATNLGSLRALVCEGIQAGHMALHRRRQS